MRLRCHPIFLLSLLTGVCACTGSGKYDVIVYGGGASGTCAAVQSSRLKVHTLLIEPTAWLGGMLTSAGVSAVDGNYTMPSGMWGEFKDDLIKHYGSSEALKTGWVSNVMFEPQIGQSILSEWVQREPYLTLKRNTQLIGVKRLKKGWALSLITGQDTTNVKAKYVIDASELGDLAAMAGIPYRIGMDSQRETGEKEAPEVKNPIIQDLTYVATLKVSKHPALLEKPAGYAPDEFHNCCLHSDNDTTTRQKLWPAENMLSYGRLPGGLYMVNWPIHGNDCYVNDVDSNDASRIRMEKAAKEKTLRFVYYLRHEIGADSLELATIYPSEDRLPLIPYYREGRRFKGIVTFSLNDLRHPYGRPYPLYRTAIAVGDYPVDQHHYAYPYQDLPDMNILTVPSYGLPIGTLLPEKEDQLLLAEKAISVTNLVNGSSRLQPVAMQDGQVAGVIAAMAVKENCAPRLLSVRKIQSQLLSTKNYLLPYRDVETSSPLFPIVQRIGVTGLLQGEGRHVNWQNQTWLKIDTLFLHSDLKPFTDFYPRYKPLQIDKTPVTATEFITILQEIASLDNIRHLNINYGRISKILSDLGCPLQGENDYLTRGQIAILLDQILHPFERHPVNIYGQIVK
jgi:hypothetical protein